jgi:hypothetical protein
MDWRGVIFIQNEIKSLECTKIWNSEITANILLDEITYPNKPGHAVGRQSTLQGLRVAVCNPLACEGD